MSRALAEQLAEATDRQIQPTLWRGKTYREFWDWFSEQEAAIARAANGTMNEDELRDLMSPLGCSLECGNFFLWDDEPNKLDRLIR